MSTGDYISLGWFEREDLAVIVDYLRQNRRVSTIGLWGRSMGAVTALMYAERNPLIAGMVLDSSFASLKVLVTELTKEYTMIPFFLIGHAIKRIRKTVMQKAFFDMFEISPINSV
jgi:pimeloyl-ACP methyl ester carboxylesterase